MSITLTSMIIGPYGAGKTALMDRYVDGGFQHYSMLATIGIDFRSKTIRFPREQRGGNRDVFDASEDGAEKTDDDDDAFTVKHMVWDQQGQSRYSSPDAVRRRLSRSNTIFVAYDCSLEATEIEDSLHSTILELPYAPKSCPIVFVACKADLAKDERATIQERGKAMIQELLTKHNVDSSVVKGSVSHFTTSSLTGEGVEECLGYTVRNWWCSRRPCGTNKAVRLPSANSVPKQTNEKCDIM